MDNTAPGMRCVCGDWFSVEFLKRLEIHEILVTGSIPMLVCRTCKNTAMPDSVAMAITAATQKAKATNQNTCKFSPAERRYDLCRHVEFKYYGADCEIIPGLEHKTGEAGGRNTPVFFKEAVLLWYRRHKKHTIVSAGAHKRIMFQDGTELNYGVNRHGRVFCLLGELAKIPQDEQKRMRAHNVGSDHDVISGLYKQKILGLKLESVAEERLKSAIYELAETSKTHVGFSIHRLEYDDRHIAEKLSEPKTWHRDITQTIVDLVKMCVESIDTKALKTRLTTPDDRIKDLKSLKSLQGWIKINLATDAESVMMPFFVLNDWRNYRVHRDGDGSLLKALKAGRAHMGMDEDEDNDEKMYRLLLAGLTESCRTLAAGIEAMRQTYTGGKNGAPGGAGGDPDALGTRSEERGQPAPAKGAAATRPRNAHKRAAGSASP